MKELEWIFNVIESIEFVHCNVETKILQEHRICQCLIKQPYVSPGLVGLGFSNFILFILISFYFINSTFIYYLVYENSHSLKFDFLTFCQFN